MPNLSELGMRLRARARETHATIDALAQRAEIKPPTLAAWCYGRRTPSPESITLLQNVFPELLGNATYEELITIHMDESPKCPASPRNHKTSAQANSSILAQALRDDMHAKGIKSTELAAALGVPHSTFRHWLKGVKPSSRHLEILRAQYPKIFNGNVLAHDAGITATPLVLQGKDLVGAPQTSDSAQPIFPSVPLPTQASTEEARERAMQIEYLFELLHYQLKWFVRATPLDRETLSKRPDLNNNMSFLGSLLTMLTGGEKHFQQWEQWTTVIFQPRNS